MIIGAIHELVGLVEGFDVSADIVADGVFDALGDDWQRAALFWFHVTGIVLLVSGDLLRAIELETGRVPKRYGPLLTAIGVGGVVLLPVSGFWLLIAWGLWMSLRARRSGPAPSLAPGGR